MSGNNSPEMIDGIQRAADFMMTEQPLDAGESSVSDSLLEWIPSWDTVMNWFSGLYNKAPSLETVKDSALLFAGEAAQIASDNAVPVAKGLVLGSIALDVTKRGLEEAGYTELSSKIPSPIQMAGKAVGKAVLFMGAGRKAAVLPPVETITEAPKVMDVESPKATAVIQNEKAEVENMPLDPKIAAIFGKHKDGAEVITYLSDKAIERLNKGGEGLANTFMKMMSKSKPGAEGNQTYLDAVRNDPNEAENLIENLISVNQVEAANSSRALTPRRRGLGTPNRNA
jgi:hypothetical protein